MSLLGPSSTSRSLSTKPHRQVAWSQLRHAAALRFPRCPGSPANSVLFQRILFPDNTAVACGAARRSGACDKGTLRRKVTQFTRRLERQFTLRHSPQSTDVSRNRYLRPPHEFDETRHHRVITRRLPRQPDLPTGGRIAQGQHPGIPQKILRPRR